MDLSKSLQYSTGSGKWSLVGPVRCPLDHQISEWCHRFDSMSGADRQRFAAQSIHADTCWTLLTFAQRMAVFALRENDPVVFLTGLRGFGLLTNNIDPRDIMTASSRMIYVAERFGFDPVQLVNDGWICQPWMRRWYLNVAERNREVDWHLKDWGIREITSELGIGLINSSGLYEPQQDILKLSMRICRTVEADHRYLSTSIQLNQKKSTSFAPTGGIWMIANPNPIAHEQMKKQMLHMRLFEFETTEQANRFSENQRIHANEAGLLVAHDKLVFTLTSRSWVSGVANVETNDSLQRFLDPIVALIQNFHRYQWTRWQAHEADGCITLTTAENAGRMQELGQLSVDSKMQYEFTAETGEVASTIHYERQGWEPYQPIGEPAPCPKQCGSSYYPAGSGDCPVCRHIG